VYLHDLILRELFASDTPICRSTMTYTSKSLPQPINGNTPGGSSKDISEGIFGANILRVEQFFRCIFLFVWLSV
jgi:hypothetical protein